MAGGMPFRTIWKDPKALRHNDSNGRGGGLRVFVALTSFSSRALARPPKIVEQGAR